MRALGPRIKTARETRAITREAMAAQFGVTERTVKHWEMAESVIEVPIELVLYLNFPLRWFTKPLAGDVHIPPRTIFWCGKGAPAEADYCAVKGCLEWAEWLCDYPVGTAGQTCSRGLCDRHAVEFGTDDDPIDYCPAHADDARKVATR
jgi:DNA-binding XRE family transcriptional regulator